MRAVFTESLVHETLFNTVVYHVYGSNETHVIMQLFFVIVSFSLYQEKKKGKKSQINHKKVQSNKQVQQELRST